MRGILHSQNLRADGDFAYKVIHLSRLAPLQSALAKPLSCPMDNSLDLRTSLRRPIGGSLRGSLGEPVSGAIGAPVAASSVTDPQVPDWSNLNLPDTWPDELFASPLKAWRLIARTFGKRRRVQVPDDMPGRELLPKYILQEFHSLPNGNYSKRLTHGYITGFDRLMLGRMRRARTHIVQSLQGCAAVLDVGCGGGRTAGMLKANGASDVWGIDPSPYLLQHAAKAFPDVQFVQGIAEKTSFADARFDGIAACFLLHEIPPAYIERALNEFRRILRPGGLLAICEPSPIQLQLSPWRLLRRDGVLGWYFWLLARMVHEPFVDAWHRRNAQQMLAKAGFEIIAESHEMPVRHILARRIG
jgi:ubiquinone/menaquinone biosynthesis C-methylase UbiE